jgi:hypothetical protein
MSILEAVPVHAQQKRLDEQAAREERALSARGRAAGGGLAAGPMVHGRALALQRVIGNRAFSALLDEGRSGQEASGGGEDPLVQRSAVDAVVSSPGQAVDPGIRARLEPEVGVDLSAVRVHTDADALRSAALIDARAYTSGRHIVIARNDMNTDVMKHEAIHVGQQSMGPVPGRDNGAGLLMSDPEDHCEREASAGESEDVRHGSGATQESPELPVQRYAVYNSGHSRYPGTYRSEKQMIGSKLKADNGPGFFPSQYRSADDRLVDSEGMANIRDTSTPPLQISDELDLAIEHGVEAKCFYATKEKFKAANKKLKELESRISFTTSSRRLVITRRSGKKIELRQVIPVMTYVGQKLEGVDIKVPQRCNEMAEFVSRQHNVESKMDEIMILAEVVDRVEPDDNLARAMSAVRAEYAKEKAPTQKMRDDYNEEMNVVITIFKDVGNKNPAEMDRAIQELRLNQHIRTPGVGDVMATSNTDRYHFGAVVAVSGSDYITMENYARGAAGAGDETLSSGDPLYFFAMYGRQQTWHEAAAGMVGGEVVVSVKLTP